MREAWLSGMVGRHGSEAWLREVWLRGMVERGMVERHGWKERLAPYHNPADGVEDISRMPMIYILIVVIAAEARQLTKCRIIWCSDSEKSPSKN